MGTTAVSDDLVLEPVGLQNAMHTRCLVEKSADPPLASSPVHEESPPFTTMASDEFPDEDIAMKLAQRLSLEHFEAEEAARKTAELRKQQLRKQLSCFWL